MVNLRNIWDDLTSNYTSDIGLVEELWNEIVKNYSSKNRYYHNLGHLAYMLDLALKYKDEIDDFDVLVFSIFYHDIVYNPKRRDNELKSAEVAIDRLKRFEVSNARIDKCHRQIMATKAHENGTEPDTNFLIDFDLAILGDKPEKYLEYTKKIRQEYAVYPDFMYFKGRKKALRHFLEMDKIFKTVVFRTNFEEQARKNLKEEIEG